MDRGLRRSWRPSAPGSRRDPGKIWTRAPFRGRLAWQDEGLWSPLRRFESFPRSLPPEPRRLMLLGGLRPPSPQARGTSPGGRPPGTPRGGACRWRFLWAALHPPIAGAAGPPDPPCSGLPCPGTLRGGVTLGLPLGGRSAHGAPGGIDIGAKFLVKRLQVVWTTDIIPLSAGSAYRGVDRGQGSGITTPVASLH